MKLFDWIFSQESYFDYLSEMAKRLAKVIKEHKYIFSNDARRDGSKFVQRRCTFARN